MRCLPADSAAETCAERDVSPSDAGVACATMLPNETGGHKSAALTTEANHDVE